MRTYKQQVLTPHRKLFDLDLKSVWHYRDLLLMFVKRDFVAVYKQTILGPAWFFIQPIFTTLIFSLIFGKAGNLSPDGKPTFLYYFAGIILWQYFADSLRQISKTFHDNKGIFGKVYFPRLVIPFSVILSNLLKFSIQLLMFIIIYFISVKAGADIYINSTIWLLPFYLFLLSGLGMGIGLMISTLTTKYRDFRFLMNFGIQLLMYITPGIIMSNDKFIEIFPNLEWFFKWNPLGYIIEAFKYGTVDSGSYSPLNLLYCFCFTALMFIIGIIVFNKTEKNFMDSI